MVWRRGAFDVELAPYEINLLLLSVISCFSKMLYVVGWITGLTLGL